MSSLHVIFGAGPAGLATMEALQRRGLQVRMVTRSSKPALPAGVELLHGDASDPGFAIEASKGAAVVYQTLNAPYHQWAELFPALQRAVLAGARASGARLVTLENLYGYGAVDVPMTEDLPLRPTSEKGKVRAAMTRELLDAASEMEIAIARASDFFGPRVTESALGERAITPILAGRSAQVVGDPDRLHAFTYMPDLGETMATLGTRDEAVGQVWHVPTTSSWTTRKAIEHIAHIAGVRPRVSAAPKALLWLLGWFQPPVREVIEMLYQFERDFELDSSHFTETFGLHATPMEQALGETVSWYRTAHEDAQAH